MHPQSRHCTAGPPKLEVRMVLTSKDVCGESQGDNLRKTHAYLSTVPDTSMHSVNTAIWQGLLASWPFFRGPQNCLLEPTNETSEAAHYTCARIPDSKEFQLLCLGLGFFFQAFIFKVSVVVQNLLDEIARREEEVQKVHTHSQQYQQAVKVRRDTPAAGPLPHHPHPPPPGGVLRHGWWLQTGTTFWETRWYQASKIRRVLYCLKQ